MSDIETRLFRYFVALAEQQHFGRAAAQLGISPPTLTHQIKKLEAQVGAKLVERRGNTHVIFTDPGVRFLQRARNVLFEAEEAAAVARQAARGMVGRIEVGFMTIALLMGLMEKFIRQFQGAHPGIEIVLRQLITVEQISAILGRNLDFGFVRMPERCPSGINGFILSREPMVIALPNDHPLAQKKLIDPASLANEPFIHYAPSLDIGPWDHMDIVGKLGHFTPRIVKHIKDMMNILSYVSAGQGLAVVSRCFMNMHIPNVAYRELATKTPPILQMAFIYRNDETSPARKAFIEFMRGHALAK